MSEHTPAPTPSRSVYGFALYLACVTSFWLYVIWAVVPDSVLHSLGITYYPQKYWALALPIYTMMGIALFGLLVYPAMNQLLVPPIGSMTTITDSRAVINRQKDAFQPIASEDIRLNGIPPASDLHISDVCHHLYLRKNKN